MTLLEKLDDVLKDYICKKCGSSIAFEINIGDAYDRFEISIKCDNEDCMFYDKVLDFDNIEEKVANEKVNENSNCECMALYDETNRCSVRCWEDNREE